MLRKLLFPMGLLSLGGCYTDVQTDFLDGRTLETCTDNVPVCMTTASCVLSPSNYTSGTFKESASRRFVVHTTSAATISVELLFTDEQAPGIDTEVAWYEVQCQDRSSVTSGGSDVFAEAGTTRIWKRSHEVSSTGDHLIEIFSDAQADYLLRVNVLPGQQ